jgi:hypothetical protein
MPQGNKPEKLLLLQGILILFQNTLFDKLFRLRPVLYLLLEGVSSHALFERTLIGLQSGRGGGIGEDISYLAVSVENIRWRRSGSSSYAQPKSLGPAASPGASSDCRCAAGVRVLAGRLGES